MGTDEIEAAVREYRLKRNREKSRAYYATHKEKCKARREKYYALHSEEIKAKSREYYELHKEKRIAYQAEYDKTHKEKHKKYKPRPGYQREYYEKHRKNNEEYKLEKHEYYIAHKDEYLERNKKYNQKRKEEKLLKSKVKFKVINNGILPKRAHPSDAAFDIYAPEDVILEPNRTTVIKTGVLCELPEGYDADMLPRSSMFMRGLFESGLIDWGYRGEIGVMIYNANPNYYKFSAGERIGQMRIAPVFTGEAVEVDELSDSDRGAGGFGSTGK